MREITIHLDNEDAVLPVDENRPMPDFQSPGAALEGHLRFHRWLLTDPAVDLFETIHKRYAKTQKELEWRARVQRALLYAVVDRAETFYVSPDMVRLTMALVDEMGDDVPVLHLSDVPASAGLVVLGLPIYLGPGDSELQEFAVTRSIAWSHFPKGLIEVNYDADWWRRAIEKTSLHPLLSPITVTFEPDNVDAPMARLQENGGILMWEMFDGGRYLIRPGAYEQEGKPPFIPSPTTAYAFDVQEPWDGEVTGTYQRRFLACLFRLMWQRVLAPETWRPDRPTARRMAREWRLPKDDLYERFKVIHLRRYEPGWETRPEPRGERGPLTHTVIVRGHWRDHWYRSLGPARLEDGSWNAESHRRIWIDPHFRGEGPLIDKHAVTAVVR